MLERTEVNGSERDMRWQSYGFARPINLFDMKVDLPFSTGNIFFHLGKLQLNVDC